MYIDIDIDRDIDIDIKSTMFKIKYHIKYDEMS